MKTFASMLLALAASALLLSCAAHEADRQSREFDVAITIERDGRVFASPRLRVEEGIEASIDVRGEGGYALTFILTETAPGEIHIDTTLDSEYGAIAPELQVREGRPASIASGDLRMTFTVVRAD